MVDPRFPGVSQTHLPSLASGRGVEATGRIGTHTVTHAAPSPARLAGTTSALLSAKDWAFRQFSAVSPQFARSDTMVRHAQSMTRDLAARLCATLSGPQPDLRAAGGLVRDLERAVQPLEARGVTLAHVMPLRLQAAVQRLSVPQLQTLQAGLAATQAHGMGGAQGALVHGLMCAAVDRELACATTGLEQAHALLGQAAAAGASGKLDDMLLALAQARSAGGRFLTREVLAGSVQSLAAGTRAGLVSQLGTADGQVLPRALSLAARELRARDPGLASRMDQTLADLRELASAAGHPLRAGRLPPGGRVPDKICFAMRRAFAVDLSTPGEVRWLRPAGRESQGLCQRLMPRLQKDMREASGGFAEALHEGRPLGICVSHYEDFARGRFLARDVQGNAVSLVDLENTAKGTPERMASALKGLETLRTLCNDDPQLVMAVSMVFNQDPTAPLREAVWLPENWVRRPDGNAGPVVPAAGSAAGEAPTYTVRPLGDGRMAVRYDWVVRNDGFMVNEGPRAGETHLRTGPLYQHLTYEVAVDAQRNLSLLDPPRFADNYRA